MTSYRRSCSVDLAIYECVHYPSGLPITPNTVSSIFKTTLCQNYLRTRRCSYGDYCKFAHSLSELLDVPAVEEKPCYFTDLDDLHKKSRVPSRDFDRAPGGWVKGRPIRPQRTMSASSDSSTSSSMNSERHYLPLFGTVHSY